jgi:hypothetical protein
MHFTTAGGRVPCRALGSTFGVKFRKLNTIGSKIPDLTVYG